MMTSWAETLVQLAHEGRHALDAAALFYVIVNETHRLVPYDQAILLASTDDSPLKAVAASGVAVLERSAPHVVWIEKVATTVKAKDNSDAIRSISQGDLSPDDRAQWNELAGGQMLWIPVCRPQGRNLGVLLLIRATAWSTDDCSALQLAAEAYGETWERLQLVNRLPLSLQMPRRRKLMIAAAAAVLLLLPVRNSALAPVQIVSRNFDVVAAPMKGVIRTIVVHPDQVVAENDVLFVYDDTELRGKYAVAAQEVSVADAALLKAQTEGIRDPKSNAETAQLQTVAELRRTELNSAAELYGRVEVRAPRQGLVVMTDPENWTGRPVETGERVLDIADPTVVEAQIKLPVNETIEVQPGDSISVYTNNEPLHSIHGHIVRTNYTPEETPDGKLIFRLAAELDQSSAPPRIGLQGMARITTGHIPLVLYILRRPFSVLRQYASVIL